MSFAVHVGMVITVSSIVALAVIVVLLRIWLELEQLRERNAELVAQIGWLRQVRREQDKCLAELHAALRAERNGVEQLRRQVQQLRLLVDAQEA
ncbi:hypothetical protein [Pseudomonas sp. D(2018)]|uniref:hypothetical protein n=1 Tax=Pseudomonas sp. D(2018) TaxID=2502238 RepID=UPI0010F46148|nr:hypothetical protein [Pseudomonas sp. D(2018)]